MTFKKPIRIVLTVLLPFLIGSYLFARVVDENTKDHNQIKIMSYNIRISHPPSKGWDETDLPATARVINEAYPDLVALQEVDVYTERSGIDVHQAKELASLTGMQYFFAKAIDRSQGSYGVAVLSRFPILEAKGYRLPVPDSTKNEIRGFAVVRVQLPCGDEMVFCSAHLDHKSDEIRLLQVQKMKEILTQYKGYPIILGADLNMTPENQVMNAVHQTVTIDRTDFPLTFPSDDPQRTIDYVLLNDIAQKKFHVTEYFTIPEAYASDHLPLMVRLKKK